MKCILCQTYDAVPGWDLCYACDQAEQRRRAEAEAERLQQEEQEEAEKK